MKHSKLLVLKVPAMLITVALMFSMAASCVSGPSPEELAAYKEREADANREEDRTQPEEASRPTQERITASLTTSNFDYELKNDGTVRITKYIDTARGIRDLVIPDKLEGYPVSEIAGYDRGYGSIGRGAFAAYRWVDPQRYFSRGHERMGDTTEIFESVTIPATVTIIGNGAFMGRGIKKIIIPESVTYIGEYAFAVNEIAEAGIPAKLKSIPKGMYQQNSIVQLTIPDTVTSIGESAFYDNNITQLVIPANVAAIEESTFRKNQLTELTIPVGVKKIGNYAFADNKLTSVTLHPNMEMSVNSFNGNPLASLVVPADITLVRPGDVEGSNTTWRPYFTDATNIVYVKFAAEIPFVSSGNSSGRNYGLVTNASILDVEKITSVPYTFPNAMAVKIGANVKGSNINDGFSAAYESNGKKAGVYIKGERLWRVGTQEEFDALIAQKTSGATAKQ